MKRSKRKRQNLEARLAETTTPLFLLNRNRQVLFFNRGCEDLTGWKLEDVVGKTCEYVTEPDHSAVESLTASLCPPPDVFEGRDVSVPAYLVNRDGRSTARLLNFIPLEDETGAVQQVLGIITPIKEPARKPQTSAVQQVHAELASLRHSLRQRYGIKGLVCRSEPMLRVAKQIQLAIASDVPVLIRGEAGTGKEHVSRLIHYESGSRARSFVPLDCHRLTSKELKGVLNRVFGNEPDEMPTAAALKPGTLLLMNVESLPRDLQSLVVGYYQGNDRRAEPPVRLMASTTVELAAAREKDELRDDLFYLLTALEIELPPLRRRQEDLVPLAQYFLEDLNRGAERQISGIAEEVWQQFREYNWPGNLDELATVIEEARSAGTDSVLTLKQLPFRFRTGLAAQAVGPPIGPKTRPLDEVLTRVETEHIQQTLLQCRYNKTQAAKLLGIPRAKLYRRMQVLGIEDREEG